MSTVTEYLVQAKPKIGDWVTLVSTSSEEQALDWRDKYRAPGQLDALTYGWDWDPSEQVRAITRYTETVVTVSDLPLERP